MGKHNNTPDQIEMYSAGEDALCNAVIYRAACDYRCDRRQIKKLERKISTLSEKMSPTDKELEKLVIMKGKLGRLKADLMQIECFFKSQRFSFFSDLDGKAVLEKLKRENIA